MQQHENFKLKCILQPFKVVLHWTVYNSSPRQDNYLKKNFKIRSDLQEIHPLSAALSILLIY